MTMARPLSLDAVLHVANRMRDQDRAEIFATMWPGDDTPAHLAMEALRVTAYGATIHTLDGEPAAALGLAPMWPGVFSAWMFATERWGEVWRGAVRHIRREIFPAGEAAGMWRAECNSLATHQDAHRFLLALGFAAEGQPRLYGRAREAFIPFARVTG
jgi:hypothetical protein